MFDGFAIREPMELISFADLGIINRQIAVYGHELGIHSIYVTAGVFFVFIGHLDIGHTSALVVNLVLMPHEGIGDTQHGVELEVSGRNDREVEHINGVKRICSDGIIDGVVEDVSRLGRPVKVVVLTPFISFVRAHGGIKLEAISREYINVVMHDRVAARSCLEGINEEILTHGTVLRRVVFDGFAVVIVTEFLPCDERQRVCTSSAVPSRVTAEVPCRVIVGDRVTESSVFRFADMQFDIMYAIAPEL